MEDMVHRDCDCCGSDELQVIYNYNFETMTKKGQFEWVVNNVVCKKCGFVFVSPVPDQSILSRFYESQYVHSHGQVIDYSIEKRITSIKKYKEINSDLVKYIDIGAGVSSERYLQKITELFESVIVIEPNKDVNAKYYSIDQLPDGCGDIIVAYDMLQHITKPHDFLCKCANALTDKGFLIIEVPNLYCYTQKPFFLTHGEIVNHFSPRSLCNLASMAGLNLIELSSLKASRDDRIFAVFSKVIGKENIVDEPKPDNLEINYATSCMRDSVEQIELYKKRLLSTRYKIDAISSNNHTVIIWGVNHVCEMLLKGYSIPNSLQNTFTVSNSTNSI